MKQIIVAQRGRDKTNHSHRGKTNENYEQFLEPAMWGGCNTITTVQKDNLVLEMVLIKQATKSGVIPCKIGGVADLNYPTSKTRRGRVIMNGEISPTLTTDSVPDVIEDWVWEIDGEKYRIRIRKLTPKECWSLMNFNEGSFEKAEKVNSNTQLYKQAGNSIVVACMEQIFKQLLPKGENNGN